MNYLYGIILGLIQGLTEFLPVSSSGHLVLFNKIFNISDNFIFLSVLLHIATLFAVIFVLHKEIWYIIRHPFSKQSMLILVATIPTVIIVLIFKGIFINAFDGQYLPVCFMFTALLLFATEFLARKKVTKPINYKIAFLMGVSQGLAVLPGISRSGSTICTGLISGGNKEEVAKFSFIMSIPIILASMLFEIIELIKSGAAPVTLGFLPTTLSFIIALGVGVFAVKYMLKLVQKQRLWGFGIYLILLTVVCFIFFY